MKALVIGRNANRIKKAVARFFQPSSKPDFAVSYGGDGTLLHAERLYPGIPKLALRSKKTCEHCRSEKIHFANSRVYCDSHIHAILEKIAGGKFRIEKIRKIQGELHTKSGKFVLEGVNDVQIRASNHIHAVRFDLLLNGKLKEKNVIGDGLVASTSFGSTAYFQSITRKNFKHGFGIAFNNPVRKITPLFFKGNFAVEARITRRNAKLIADNNPKTFSLKAGDRIFFRPSKNSAQLMRLE